MSTEPQSPPRGGVLTALLPRLILLALLWWVLTGGARDGWGLGLLVIVLAVWLSLVLRAPQPWRLSLAGALRFVPYFCWQSVRGGFDVTRRAFSPGLPLAPLLLEHPLRLPPGTARIFLLNTVSLLPGTLSAQLHGDRLVVHGLDGGLPLAQDLRRLESRVAGLFGLRLGGSDG
ncbi:Na+/H+ antiporter subunit E [Geoalkalibacter halelectricus]|uniref:Na+/H+ antiporter subunit E n=1 Tax=Geoalkalibacter halelectricus TaxID=2847045 RepID=A0ABY5ZH20_9BACT|nr:Na+/H+ antiporter subunit E [Geoalkalibacter halelectricus]MDO3377946.1 Na+/H+ antiporter subunit E [Geoalkalibacter halelectricus]UWZ77873.1 Na+/H+ antiporter subunit E [Geoalkalibacter halelectricus]